MRKFIYIALVLLAALVVYFYSEYNKAPETAKDKKSDYVFSVEEFTDEFIKDAVSADKKYKNKTIELSGIVAEIKVNDQNTDVVLECDDPMTSINIQLIPEALKDASLKAGEPTRLRAVYVGVLTDLGTDIELNQAVILK